jgi:hypothetical protein
MLEVHRANPSCAGCHWKMDAIGVSLENFDARGAWRTMRNVSPVEAVGVMPDGETLDGPAGLKAYLLKHHRDTFVRALGENLLRYALGRKLDDADRAALSRLPANVRDGEYRFSRVIMEVVTSESFRRGFALDAN